ncbi:MAG: hypothetical protein KAT00_05780 [Planctomycetes bacterium]|nr:hypothetical protein [Planctomycetota bacterium]
MAKRGNIKKFLLGVKGGIQLGSGLNLNQQVRLQEYGQMSARAVLFLLKWTAIALIFKAVHSFLPLAEVIQWLVK